MSAFSLLISPGVVTKNLPRLTERSATDTWKSPPHLDGVFFCSCKVSSLRWITWALIHFRCHGARPVSYYAFFKGWLLPSPPPGCHRSITSFSTKWLLRDLSVRSGLFPSRLWILAPQKSVCTNEIGLYSEFPWGLVPLSALPRAIDIIRSTEIDFAENQLYPILVGLSPPATSHPRILPHTWVRSSKAC